MNETYSEKIRKTVDEKTVKIFRAVCISVFNRVIKESPVDTGRFRGNWQATINFKAIDEVGESAKPQAWSGEIKLTDTLFLINNLVYAVPLADGHSKQAEAGWIDRAVEAGVISYKNAVDKLK